MKKILLLVTVLLYLLACKTSSDKPKNELRSDSTNVSVNDLKDSMVALDDAKACSIFVDLAYWKISDNKDAEDMIKDSACATCDPKYNKSKIKDARNRILDKLICRYGMDNVTTYEARYKTDEDVARYCEKRGIDPASEKGKVKNYKTWIVRVTTTQLVGDPEYYDFVTICPPPEGGCAAK
ncbi:MAG: hypothetical protein M3004_01555 [Bacteroidota bacterium]|nr:hypothetical protein [Bacteroidota bacterium]